MRKLLAIILSIVCTLGAVFCITSCQEKKSTYNEAYIFDKITFRKSDKLTIEDLSAFIPSSIMIDGKTVNTIKDFEDLLHDNLDTYSIVQNVNGTNERIFLAPKYYSIFLKTDDIISVGIMNDGILTYEEYSYTKKNYEDRIEYLTDNENFTFSNNTMTYDFSFPLEPTNSFVVIYNYKH